MTNDVYGRAFIESVLPHGPSMCLLDAVEWATPASIRCRGLATDEPKHPLAHNGTLAAVHAVEYAAQAAAVHGAIRRGGTPTGPGAIASVRKVDWNAAVLEPGPLWVECELRTGDTRHCSYAFSATGIGDTRVSGELMVVFRAEHTA